MTNLQDTPRGRGESTIRIRYLEATVEELRAMYPRTKDDPALEKRRSIMVAAALALLDAEQQMKELGRLPR